MVSSHVFSADQYPRRGADREAPIRVACDGAGATLPPSPARAQRQDDDGTEQEGAVALVEGERGRRRLVRCSDGEGQFGERC